MQINVAIDQLRWLIAFLENYREDGLTNVMVETKEIASEMKIEPIFYEQRVQCRKKKFDENVSEELTHSVHESF